MDKKLSALRKLLAQEKLAGYLQPVNDEYMSEYPPASNRRVEWLAGFSGSAGTVAVLRDNAALFTDGRYTLQAEKEVGAEYERHNSGKLTPEAWLADMLTAGDKVGYDPKLYTPAAIKRMQAVLEKKSIMLAPCANLVDRIWEDRPEAPASAVFIHDMKYAGESLSDKRNRIARQVAKEGADVAVIAAPDAVCWLLNIRGRDVESTPLVLAPALIDTDGNVQLFVEPGRCSAEVSAHLGNHVEICSPATLEQHLIQLGKEKKNVLCDPATAPVWFTQVLTPAGAKIIEGQEPCILPKATKNAVELQGIRAAHIRDGVAIVKLLCWLDDRVKGHSVTEMEVSDKLRGFRAQSPMFVEPSFTTIAGSGPNGAIVHYRVTPESNRTLQKGELFLLDSGGQYPDGTTDITRTIAIGEPSPEHKDRFTRVLKGHIAIALAKFPEGTSGGQLDVLARQYLWQSGMDYDHGTGHGVGCFLGVHEGPQRISKRGGDAPLKAGMVVSNEPGYYKTGEYGIRIENLVTVVETNERWLGLDTLTCAPLDTHLVDVALLTQSEKDWLNSYHAWVLRSLLDGLEPQECDWLKARCQPV